MQSPWRHHYDAGVPHSLAPYPRATLLDYLSETTRLRPDHPVLLFKGATVTAAELERASDAFAAALAGLGVRPGDCVALLLPNCPQFVIAELGAWKAGASVLPLNPTYTEHELVGPLTRMGVETLVTLTLFYDRVVPIRARTPLKRVIATSIKEYLPVVTRALFTVLKERADGHRVQLRSGDHMFSDLLKRHDGAARPAVQVGPDDAALILLSGGTTGTPKGVVGLHRCLVTAALQLQAWLRPVVRDWDDRILLPLPLFHVFGNVGVQGFALVGRNPLALVPNPRDIKDLLATIRQVKPAFFVGVPALFSALLAHPDVRSGKVDFRSMKLCFSGASALLAETRRRFEELTGGTLIEGYSLTEAMIAAAISPVLGPKKSGSMGLPLPDVDMRVVDPDDGARELPAGAVGEIVIHAPQLMAGYWQDPAETAQVLRERDGVLWLHTGDLGYRDDEGYFFYVDRIKDLIKTSGFQVWPREIEEVIAGHPAVAEVGVAGLPDDAKGEVVAAWVVTRAGMTASAAEIRAHCRDRLAPYKVPTRVEFCDALPLSGVGKVLRRALTVDATGAV
jgi:long-chain acyl-CoA synthetase